MPFSLLRQVDICHRLDAARNQPNDVKPKVVLDKSSREDRQAADLPGTATEPVFSQVDDRRPVIWPKTVKDT